MTRVVPAGNWNNFSCGEHTGTHFDATIHWISGKELANNSVDTIPAQHFVAPACVIDCSEQAKADADYLIALDDIARSSRRTGASAKGRGCSCAPTGPSAPATPRRTRISTRRASNTPGPSVEAVRFLVEERRVLGFGSEAIGTDAGQGAHLRPPYPCHYYMHGAGRYGLHA